MDDKISRYNRFQTIGYTVGKLRKLLITEQNCCTIDMYNEFLCTAGRQMIREGGREDGWIDIHGRDKQLFMFNHRQ